ncbi:MAG: transposase [Acidobacteria bacterium]|nr:transposase [Acidobacteriota bacterium]
MRLAPQETRTYFVTTVTANRRRLFQVAEIGDLMLETLQHYRNKGKFALHGFVVMPEHLHLLITPATDVSLEKAIQFIKGGFSFRLKSKRDVWERGFNEVQICFPEKFKACMRYIEENPVRARLAAAADQYKFSSASRKLEVDPIPEHFILSRFRG